MKAVQEVKENIGVATACEALGVSRSSYYHFLKPVVPASTPEVRARHFRALSAEEQAKVLECLNSERFQDQSPAEVYAALLDESTYHCSISTMYRILSSHNQVKERRNQLIHPNYVKPELLATAPKQVWSWDITKLLGPQKWTYFYLYVIMDIFSRYAVGWMVAHRESSELAKRLIKDSCNKQNIEPGQLIIHADRGSSMKSKPVALLLSDLGVTKTHSRPHVSNDNPFSESHFKTLKYRPEFPVRFGSIEDARSFCRLFFNWYNWEHHHSGLGLLTPGAVHYGQAGVIREQRQSVLGKAFISHPERFVKKFPTPPEVPQAVWINPPEKLNLAEGGVLH